MAGHRDGDAELTVTTRAGRCSGLDFGGSGPDVILIHDVAENAASWLAVAESVRDVARVRAIDLPGHGPGNLPVTDLADMFGKLREAVDQLAPDRPLLVGQGLGGAVATALVLTGLPARGLVLLEGVFPWSWQRLGEYREELYGEGMLEMLARRYRWGHRCATDARAGLVEAMVSEALDDWNYAGAPEPVLRAMFDRAWQPDPAGEPSSGEPSSGERHWVRLPTPADVTAWTRPEPVFGFEDGLQPWSQITVPTLLLQATGGLYAEDPDAFDAILRRHPERRLQVLDSTWNLSYCQAPVVSSTIRAMLLRTAGPPPTRAR